MRNQTKHIVKATFFNRVSRLSQLLFVLLPFISACTAVDNNKTVFQNQDILVIEYRIAPLMGQKYRISLEYPDKCKFERYDINFAKEGGLSNDDLVRQGAWSLLFSIKDYRASNVFYKFKEDITHQGKVVNTDFDIKSPNNTYIEFSSGSNCEIIFDGNRFSNKNKNGIEARSQDAINYSWLLMTK